MVHVPLSRHSYTRWTPERQHMLATMWNDGASVVQIAAALAITAGAVYKKAWLMRHATTGLEVTKRKPGRPRKPGRKGERP